MTDIQLRHVDELNCRVVRRSWRFVEERSPEITAHWQGLVAARPRLFDGRVLMIGEEHAADRNVMRTNWFETDYSAFLAWRDFGFPDQQVRNGFAMAALQGRDGGFVLARMGEHTANPGRIYFACGTPDREDVRGDVLDLEGSAIRELMEETSLAPGELIIDPGWTLVDAGPRLAFMKSVRVDLTAHDLAHEIEHRLRSQADPELAGMYVVTSRAQLKPDLMPDFILAYLDEMLGPQPG